MMDASGAHQVEVDERFLLVRCGSSCFALPMDRVRRVLRSLRTFPVPGSRRELVGLLQHAGEPIPVLDLAALVDGEVGAGSTGTLTVIVAVDGSENPETLGVAVHDAMSVVRVAADRISPSENATIRGEVMIDGDLVRVFDPAALSRPSS